MLIIWVTGSRQNVLTRTMGGCNRHTDPSQTNANNSGCQPVWTLRQGPSPVHISERARCMHKERRVFAAVVPLTDLRVEPGLAAPAPSCKLVYGRLYNSIQSLRTNVVKRNLQMQRKTRSCLGNQPYWPKMNANHSHPRIALTAESQTWAGRISFTGSISNMYTYI